MPVPATPADKWERERRRTAHQALMIVRVLLLAIGLMPWWIPLARAYLPIGPVGAILDGLFIVVCHRLPARTIELAGQAMPVCSRCAGIFTGLAIGAALAWPRLPIRWGRWALLAAAAIMLGDVLSQDLGLHPPWHASRLITGALLGWAASSALVAAIMRERRMVSTRRESGSAP
jgi:uncharacterized membrane protein